MQPSTSRFAADLLLQQYRDTQQRLYEHLKYAAIDETLLTQCRDAQGGLYEQLNYEAIKEQAGMDDSQLVYVSFSNEALAHLPYMVALDESSR
jgi:hypothetical protein